MVTGSPDPVAVVRAAHREGRAIALDTSGTSGTPRRVVRSTQSWWSSFAAYGELTGVDRSARLWLPGPLAATMNLFAAVHADVVGAGLVARPADASHACVTPSILDRRLEDLPPGTTITVAGAALPRPLAERAEAAGHRTRHYYGAAELSFVAAGPHAEALRPFPGVDVEIREGEIWVRSPYLALVDAAGDGPLRLDGDWVTVGDLGTWNDDRLVVIGRPDAVTTAGATVVLDDVERVLAATASSSVACFGLPRASVGEVLAIAVSDPGDVPALRRAARAELPPSHRPRAWFLAADLPLTGVGKLDRRTLAERAAEGALSRA